MVKRSFLLCEKERRNSELLSDLIETEVAGNGSLMFGDPDGTPCQGIYIDGNGRRKKCAKVRRKPLDDQPRRVTLFTIVHGDISILVLDWMCPVCTFINRYE